LNFGLPSQVHSERPRNRIPTISAGLTDQWPIAGKRLSEYRNPFLLLLIIGVFHIHFISVDCNIDMPVLSMAQLSYSRINERDPQNTANSNRQPV